MNNITLKKLLDKAKNLLRENSLEENLSLELLYYLNNWDNNFITLNLNLMLEEKFIKNYLRILNIIISKNYPIQYFFNKSFFYNRPFYVNKNVLIPRYDSEILIETILKENPSGDILEIGTGSGVLIITLKLLLKDKINAFAVDISNKALMVAKKNAKAHNTKVTFLKSNLFSKVKSKYNVILANLPYLKETEIKGLLKHEPRLALDGGEKGLEIIFRFLNEFNDYLKDDNSFAIIEHNPEQSPLIKDFLNKKHKNLAFFQIKDYNKLDRFLLIKRRSK